LREEHRLGVLENRALTKIFGPKRDDITGEWRKLCTEEFNDLYCTYSIVRVIISRRMRWTGYVACMWERSGIYRVMFGKPEGKEPLGRHKHRW
jgi:hypothetical protein